MRPPQPNSVALFADCISQDGAITSRILIRIHEDFCRTGCREAQRLGGCRHHLVLKWQHIIPSGSQGIKLGLPHRTDLVHISRGILQRALKCSMDNDVRALRCLIGLNDQQELYGSNRVPSVARVILRCLRRTRQRTISERIGRESEQETAAGYNTSKPERLCFLDVHVYFLSLSPSGGL